MAYPNRGLEKAAMKHYLTESAHTALEALDTDGDVVELGPGKQMPVVGPNQILDMPLYTKIPFLPGSNTMFYTTNLGEKLYQPSATFDLSDPYCQIMAPRYKSLHDPHLQHYYKRKENLRMLKKAGHITNKNKVVCSLKEFNQYRQYLTSLKLEFEKHYMREQKMLEKQITKLQEANVLPEGVDTSKYRDWMLKEERPTIQEQEAVMRNRYLELINQELEKLEQLAEENRRLSVVQDDTKKEGFEIRKQLLLRKKMEEEWRKKEMMLLMKIGDDVKREARIVEQHRKSKEEKLKRKHVMLEKKMAYHLRKLQEQFEREGFLPPGQLFPRAALEDHGLPLKRLAPAGKKRSDEAGKDAHAEKKPEDLPGDQGPMPPEGFSPTKETSQVSLAKTRSSTKPSVTTLSPLPGSEVMPSKSPSTVEQETALKEPDLSRKGSLLDSEAVGESIYPQSTGSKVSFSTVKDVGSTSSFPASSKNDPLADLGPGSRESTDNQVAPSASGGAIGTLGEAPACGTAAGCGSKTSCCGSAGCGSRKSCSGSAGCGSAKSCCGSAGCGSSKSCCGSAGCGSSKFCCGSAGCGSSKLCCGSARCGSSKSCCGSAGCGSSKSCCGSAGCGSRTSCCGSGGCCSNNCKCCGLARCGSNNRKGTGSSDSSGSSKHGAGRKNGRTPFSSCAGTNQSNRTPPKASTQTTVSAKISEHTVSEGADKVKHKKRATLMLSQDEPDGLTKEKGSSKKRRVEKIKTEHKASSARDNEDTESSYSMYLHRMLSNTDHSALRESLKGKVSTSELNGIIQNIMTWVVSAVTSILYPALTKFEERVRTRVYTISEESILSSDNSSSCSTCNEDIYEASARKLSFTNTTIKPTAGSARESKAGQGKPTSLLTSKSSFTSFTKSTQVSLDSDLFIGKFKRGKSAVLWAPSKHSGFLSTSTSVRSSKSDSQITQMRKGAFESPDKLVTAPYHSRHKSTCPRGLFSKMDLTTTTTMSTTDTDQVSFLGGENKPPHGLSDQRQAIILKDTEGIFAELKTPLTQMTAIVLNDIFKQILGDLGCSATSISISMEILLESISDSLLGSCTVGPPLSGSASRIASFVACDLVEDVMGKLKLVAQKTYTETVSKADFAAECQAMCFGASGKHTLPDPAFWKNRMSLCPELMCGLADEIVQLILDKLKAFALSSQTKVSQFELFAKIKAIGIPLEQIYAAASPHSIECEAATAIVKDTIRKIVSKTVASSETNILQYVEEMIVSILSYIQRQLSPGGKPLIRESSIILQLINEVFNSLSTEKLRGIYPAAKCRASSKTPGEPLGQDISTLSEAKGTTVTTNTLFEAEMLMRTPFPPVNVPGMVTYPEVELEKKGKEEPSGKSKEQKVLVAEEEEGKVQYESFGLDSRQRSRPRSKSARPAGEGFLDKDGKTGRKRLERAESCLENFVHEAIFFSLEGQQTVGPVPGRKGGTWALEQALEKLEEDLKEGEGSPIIPLVQKLLNETLQQVWAERPVWPHPAPSSVVQVGLSREHPQDHPPSKEHQPEFSGHPPVSESEVRGFAGDLVKTTLQRISQATQTDPQGLCSRHTSLVFTDILPLKEPTEGVKGSLTVHFKDPEMTFESRGPPPGGTRALATNAQELPSQLGEDVPSKPDLARDLVEIFVTKLECFVTSKVESQLGLDVQNLKTSVNSDLSSAIQQELMRILANRHGSLPSCLEELLKAHSNSLLAEKDKAQNALPVSYSNLKSYAQEVARTMLKSLKQALEKEVENIPTPPVIFSESITACHIVSMVFSIVAPVEHDNEEAQHHFLWRESVLEKLLKKNAAYKRDLQIQIQNTVETFLNEIYHTIMLEVGGSSSGPEKFQTPPVEGLQVRKTREHRCLRAPPNSTVVKSDISTVSGDLVDIVIEDLSSGLAAALHKKGPLSTNLQALLFELVHKSLEPSAPLVGRRANVGTWGSSAGFDAGSRGQIPGLSKAEKKSGSKMGKVIPEPLPELRDISPEGIATFLVDNISLRLEMFVEEKLQSELAVATHPEKKRAKGRKCCQKAKLAVEDSQSNLRLCAEKLTCTVLKIIQQDLEREMLSCQNLLPYEDNASANEIMNDLLKILSVQIALTENEVQKRVLRRIFKRRQPGEQRGHPLLAGVEVILNQAMQRILGDLGHLPGFHDSLFLSSKSSACHGVAKTVSQASTGGVAGEIVDGVLTKMYTVIADKLFSSSESGSGVDSLGSDKDPGSSEVPRLLGKPDIQKMTLALSQLQPPPQSLGEELVQMVLNQIASFAATNLEEVLPPSMKRKHHTSFHHDMQAGDGLPGWPTTSSEDSESSLMRVNVSKSDLTVYAKDVVGKVLGGIMDEFKAEDYHRTILRVNTLSSEQVALASDLVHSIVRDLHISRQDGTEGLPSTQMHLHFEATVKDAQGKPKCLFYEDFSAFLKQVLPKEGILKDIFEQQPLTDANINESLKMLQVAENIVSEVFMRIRDLEPSVGILKKTPGDLSERLFCYSFKRAESPSLFHSDSQAEIGSAARDIVASVFENVHKCLVSSVPTGSDKDAFLRKKDRTVLRGLHKHRFTQPDFPFYNVSLKGAVETIDKIAKETVECVVVMLETFVARHFKRDFKCNFMEIVKFPLESLTFAQLTRSLDSLSTQVGNVAEIAMEGFRNKLQGALPTLGSAHNLMDFSKLGGAISRECIETAIRQVQMLHSELSVYANNAVSGVLEIIKHTLDRELVHKEATMFSSSSESLALSETLSVMLDRCNESLTEITSELMVENLQLEMSGGAIARNETLVQDLTVSPGIKTTSKKYRRLDSFPPINVPGMVVYSEEEEAEVQEEIRSKFPSVNRSSERGPPMFPKKSRYMSLCTSTRQERSPGRRRQNRGLNKPQHDFLEDEWLPRQSSIPEGTILEKLFQKAAEFETIPRLNKARPQSKGGLVHHPHRLEKQAEPFGRGPMHQIPENVCYSAICPLKLGQTAKTIVNTLFCELGLENEPKKTRPLSSLKEKIPKLGASSSSAFVDLKQRRANLLNLWEKRQSDSSKETKTVMEDSCLLSKWESKQSVFSPKSPETHKDMELLACSHLPDASEIHLLANHIVLSVIKELISFQSKDTSDDWPAWKQELLQSESRWLQERIWRSSYVASARKPFSCLEMFWEPLTLTVVSSILLIISNPNIRYNTRERNQFFESNLSVFCSVDAGCPEHDPGSGFKSSLINIKEIAFHISEVIVEILCKERVLHEGINRQDGLAKRSKYIYIPPLCLADFDDIYPFLVKEVGRVLFAEIERGKYGEGGQAGDRLSQQPDCVPPVCFSQASRGDCRSPRDVKGATCLSTINQLASKNPQLSCIASNLDTFICSLKSSESKRLVNKVLHIILDSLWPELLQGGFSGPFANTRDQNMVSYQEADLPSKGHLLSPSVCPHVSRLSNKPLSSNLGLSTKSVVLLDTVSEKLIRSLLDKCLMTEHFTGHFAFDEFPEEKQLYNVQRFAGEEEEEEEEPFRYSQRGMEAHQAESSTTLYTYDIKYNEEPWIEAQSRLTSYESALDVLAHTLVKPVMTELSLSIEKPDYTQPFGQRGPGFTKPSHRKAHGQAFGRKHGRHAKSRMYSAWPPGRKPEPKGPYPRKRQNRKSSYETGKTVLETAMQHRTFDSRWKGHISRSDMRKPVSSTKKTSRREVMAMTGHGDHSQVQAAFSVLYSSLFLEEVVSLLLIKIFSSLQHKCSSDAFVDLREMNMLFVNALMEEFEKAGVGVLLKAEEKWYFPRVDGQTVNRIVESIMREFGFQLAADRDIGRNVTTLAKRASEIILMAILDYQLPPQLGRRLPQNALKHIKAEQIVWRIEPFIGSPKGVKHPRESPPTYVTVLSQKYLERVINRLVAQLFPPLEGLPEQEEKRGLSEADFDDLCAHMLRQVMASISKHRIWVGKKDDGCNLHSEKEVQGMADSVYRNMLEKSGSPQSIQKEVKSQDSALVDNLTSFIIQEVTQHHLQSFLPKDGHPGGSPDPEALSENIVRTVLGSIGEPGISQAELFPAKFLEEIVSKVLSNVFSDSKGKKGPSKRKPEAELAKVAKRLASAISLQFGRAAVTGATKRDEHSLESPLTDIMKDVVDSVCNVISKEPGLAPEEGLSHSRENALFENIKLLVGKEIADKLLHPLFSGDSSRAPPSTLLGKEGPEKMDGAFREEDESRSPFSTFLSSGFLRDLIKGFLTRIFPPTPPRDTSFPCDQELMLSEPEIDELSAQLLDEIRRKLLTHEIRVAPEGDPEQCDYSEEDVQHMTDSLCDKIIQRSGSLEAAQREVESRSCSLIERISSFLISNILQKHFRNFVSREEPPPLRDRKDAGDSVRGVETYWTMTKPLDLRQEETGGPSASSLLGDVISELLSKLSGALSNIPLPASGDHIGGAALRLAQSLTKELTKPQLSVQEGSNVPLDSLPPETGRRSPHRKAEKNERGLSLKQSASLACEEAANHLFQSACPSSEAEVVSLLKERLLVDQEGPEMKPPAPYTTELSYPMLETLVGRVMAQIFPASSSSSLGSGQGEDLFGSKTQDRMAQIQRDIVEAVLKQAIWTSTYGSEEEVGISEEAVENMVDSVYCDVLHEVMLQQPIPEDRDSLSNLYVTQIACFVINEMFKYHLQSSAFKQLLPCKGNLPDTCMTIFPCSVLEKVLHQLLERIFPTPESVATYLGKQVDFSEVDFIETAVNLKNYIIAEISAHEIKLGNVSEKISNMDQETEEDIANSVYNQVLQKYNSTDELQNSFSHPGNSAVPEIANLLIREILNFHLHPFLSGGDASNNESVKWQRASKPFSRHIYSAAFLEDIVVAFFCKILSSPNFLSHAKDTSLPEGEMRDRVVKLVNALVTEFKMSEVKVMHSMEEGSFIPQVAVDDVIQTGSSIYEKLLQQYGSEFEISKDFQSNPHMLAETLAPLMIREISGYQLMPLFTADTSSYLFSFLEAETIMDRVETILPEPTPSSSVFGEMFVKILNRIFPLWVSNASTDSPDPAMGDMGNRGLSMVPMKKDGGVKAGKNIKSLMGNICKTVCGGSEFPERERECTAEETSGFLSQRGGDLLPPKSPSPLDQPDLSSALTAKTAGWTIHHVKLGDREPQMTPIEDSGGTYSSTFLQNIFSSLISKMLSSTPGICDEKKETEGVESSLKNVVESLLKEFMKSPVKVLQVPEGAQTPPGVEKTVVVKIVHAALCSILQARGPEAPICTKEDNLPLLVERLASALKKEMLGYQIQEMPAKTSQLPLCKHFDLEEMAQKILLEVKKASTPSPISKPGPLLMSQKFIHEVLAFFLFKILPLPTEDPAATNAEDQCAEFDFIHMKLLSKVMDELSKDQNVEVQYLDRVQPNRVMSQTVANSIYNNLLPEFGSPSVVEKCIRTGCTILLERIAEFVLEEFSGHKMQTYFLEERNRQQEAMEAERELEERYEEGPETMEWGSPLRSHLKGLSIIILEEVLARLLSKIVRSFPMDDVDEQDLDSMREVAKRIITSLQGLISNNKLKVCLPEDMGDLGSEDSQTVGEVVDSVYTNIIKHSSSETSLYEDLTSENKEFANRVACFMVSEISKHDFQSGSESEEEFLDPSSAIGLESEKIIQRFLADMVEEKAKKEPLGGQGPVVPVDFLEEILSRFLTTVFLTQYDLGIHEKKNLSKKEVNEIVELLKTSVEKEMTKNKIGLVASNDRPTLDPQFEEMVDQIVCSVLRNVMEKSGSQQELYNDMTKNQVIFPGQVASMIINEISSCNIANPPNENGENETRSALELDRIVSKVIARVSCHMEPDEEPSLLQLKHMAEAQAEFDPDADSLLESEELPVHITPYYGKKALKIDPNLVSKHLAVISIKTEPLNKLEKTCLSRTGMSLMELRRASASGKGIFRDMTSPETNKKERRPSLDMCGRLGVKPREAVCRNSFQSLIKPDIRRVELLKDVESKQDLIMRLVVHDIKDQNHLSPDWEESDADEEEQVLTEHRSFYFPPTAPSTENSMYSPSEFGSSRKPSISQKKSFTQGRGYPTITVSPTGGGKEGTSTSSTLPSTSIMTQSTVGQIPEVDEEVSGPSTPFAEKAKSLPSTTSQTSLQSEASEGKSPMKEISRESVVGMHLSRDTEETPGYLEITSVYQDKKIQDSASEQPSEMEDGKVINVTSPEAQEPQSRRSSVLRKVSDTLSKVFSRTSAAGEEKTGSGDQT